ncbi:thioredoxin family protein [Youngiibacter multivorans]|uniref:Thioredoxin 1 n=1 Tax=Youngiibacter multivorans TaxID=937251 RepID=A0ABS4G5B4_9CLOT|nr:thioredoxin family protein [Youngiibacter multivorans]MBP1919753.1 thioredoxin 1 [Youngiibacter multivorans]
MIELKTDSYAEVLKESEVPVFVDFFGESCAICMELLPGVHEMEKEFEGKVIFASVDTGVERKLAMKERVMGLPTMAIYANGEKKSVAGPKDIKSLDDVRAFINGFLENK